MENVDDDSGGEVMFTTRLSCGRRIELLPGGALMPLEWSNRMLYTTLLRRARLAESRVQMSRIRLGRCLFLFLEFVLEFVLQFVFGVCLFWSFFSHTRL